MKNSFLRLDALQGRRAISAQTYAIAVPGLFLIALEYGILIPGITFADGLVGAIAATSVSVLVLVLSQCTILRNRDIRPVPVAIVLGVYFFTAVAGGVASALVRELVQPLPIEETIYQIFGSVPIAIAWLSIVAMLLASTDRDRHATMQLRTRQAELEYRMAYYQQAVAQGRSHIAALVDSVAAPAIAQAQELANHIDSGTSVSAAELSDVALKIRDRAEGEVRTLSHLLNSPEPQMPDYTADPPPVSVRRPRNWYWLRRALRKASVDDPIQPAAVMFTVLLIAVPLPFYGIEQGPIIGMFAATVVGFAGLALARKIVTPRLVHWPGLIRAIVLAFAFAVVAAADSLILVATSSWISDPFPTVLRTIELFLIVGLAWALVAAGTSEAARAQRQLSQAVEALEVQNASLRADLAEVEKRAAEIVHGRVQGYIIAAAMVISLRARRLSKDQTDADQLTVKALSDASELLYKAKAEVDLIKTEEATNVPGNIGELLHTIASGWADVLEIEVKISASANHRLEQLPIQRQRVADVAREAIANSARHGSANRARISLEYDEPSHTILMRITDNGFGVSTHPRLQSADAGRPTSAGRAADAGMGMQQIAQATSDWSLTNSPSGGAILTARFALEPVPAETAASAV